MEILVGQFCVAAGENESVNERLHVKENKRLIGRYTIFGKGEVMEEVRHKTQKNVLS